MTIIQTSRDINTKTDNLWDVISNVDKGPNLWHKARSIKNLGKEWNTIEREKQ